MIHRRYLLSAIAILSLIAGLSSACKKSKNEGTSPYPAILSVKITPENPKTTHDLNVVMEGVEGSNLTFKYLWKRNGEEILGETFKTLRHINFSKHDTISVMVTPVREEVMGKSVESDPVVIINIKPVISAAIIQPQPAYTNSQLEIMVETSDDDDDYILYSYQWIKNDQVITDETSKFLSSLNFERGDRICCKVIPSDREVEGRPFTTEPIIIANSSPLITSTPPSDVVFEHSFTYKVAAEDSDQDNLVFSLSSSAPEAMIIDPANGILEWKIPKDLTGVYPIEIIVSDGYGGRCSQSFSLSID